MAESAEGHAPFDERIALDELERLRQAIEHYRLQRKTVADQFDQFVSGLKPSPEPVRAFPQAVGALPAPAGAPPSPEPIVDALTARLRGSHLEERPTAIPERIAVPVLPEPRTQIAARSNRPRMLVMVVLVAILGGTVAWAVWKGMVPGFQGARVPGVQGSSGSGVGGSEAPASNPTPPTAAPAIETAPPPASLTPAAPEAPAVEVTTTRSVWLRITVDGERVLERQLPADTRVPLKPQSTIVIRTGDAGAVRLTIGGKDQGLLGRNGEVITKSFTIPPAPAR
jgi:hypothetical protein